MNADMKKRGLGRGLDALFREVKSEEQAFAAPAPAPKPAPPVTQQAAPQTAVKRADEMVAASQRLAATRPEQNIAARPEQKPAPAAAAAPATTEPPRKLPVSKLLPGKFQPRRLFREDELAQLSDSIRVHGILQPLIVRPLGNNGMYEIIGGERRWRAAQKAQLHEVPVVIRPMSDKEALEIGLIENLQREDLTALEEAEGYQKLMDEFGHTQETLSHQLGRSRSHVANQLRLLRLPIAVREMIQQGVLSSGHARVLVGAENAETLARQIVQKNLSVRQAEKLAKGEATGKKPQAGTATKAKAPEFRTKDVDILALEEKMTSLLGLNVLIDGVEQGKLVIEYRNLAQLDDLLARLSSSPRK